MKIDYFCFSVPSLGLTDYSINGKDDENTVWLKSKEKELMDAARNNNMLLIFDRTTKKFYSGNEAIDIKDKVIFPRSFILYEKELLTELEKQGAISIEMVSDMKKTENWPQKTQPVHRKVVQTTYRDFQLHADDYKKVFKNLFFKTMRKTHTHDTLDFYGFIDFNGEKVFITKPSLWNVSLDDSVFLSESFQSIQDRENDMDCKEYRAFVLNNKLLSVSRSYVDYPTKVPNDVIDFLEEQISKNSSLPDFPSSYVLDVGQMLLNGKEVIDIIEYNSICSSGLEVCNSLVDELIKQQQQPCQLVKKRTKPVRN